MFCHFLWATSFFVFTSQRFSERPFLSQGQMRRTDETFTIFGWIPTRNVLYLQKWKGVVRTCFHGWENNYKLTFWSDKRYNSLALIGQELLSCISWPMRIQFCKYQAEHHPSHARKSIWPVVGSWRSLQKGWERQMRRSLVSKFFVKYFNIIFFFFPELEKLRGKNLLRKKCKCWGACHSNLPFQG